RVAEAERKVTWSQSWLNGFAPLLSGAVPGDACHYNVTASQRTPNFLGVPRRLNSPSLSLTMNGGYDSNRVRRLKTRSESCPTRLPGQFRENPGCRRREENGRLSPQRIDRARLHRGHRRSG